MFVGIDVAKDTLEVAVRPLEEQKTFSNNEEGIGLMIEFIASHHPVLIVLEATGSFELQAVAGIAATGLPVVVMNPRQVRDFAKATGKLAKTDKIDAPVIARFAEAVRPEVRPLKDEEAQELDALATRRRQVIDMIVAEKNRLVTARKWTRKDIEEHIMWLKDCLKKIDKDLSALIKKSPLWREKETILRECPKCWFCHRMYSSIGGTGTGNAQPQTNSRPCRSCPYEQKTAASSEGNAAYGEEDPMFGPSYT